MRCLLWVQPLIDILPHFLQWCVQYHVILDHVITALDCIARIIAFLFQILTLLSLQFLLTLVYFQIYITEQWHFIKNSKISVQENAFENAICKWYPFCSGHNILTPSWFNSWLSDHYIGTLLILNWKASGNLPYMSTLFALSFNLLIPSSWHFAIHLNNQ